MADDRVVSRRQFGYGDRQLVPGEVAELLGLPNDEKLLRLGYFERVRAKAKAVQCNQCGREFLELGTLQAHGRRDHDRSPHENPEDEDRYREAEEAKLNLVAPLYLDKTAASQRA
jgi:hypothetical protein